MSDNIKLNDIRLSESNRLSDLSRTSEMSNSKSYLNNVKIIQFSNGNSNHDDQENCDEFYPSDEDVKNYESIFNSLFMYSYGPDSLVRQEEYLLSALKAALPKLHYDMKLFPDNGFNSKDSLNRFVEDDILTDLKENKKPLYDELCHCLEILYIGLSIAVQNTAEHNAQNNIDRDRKLIRTDYPEFFDSTHILSKGIDSTEVYRLTLFRYVLKIAFTIIPAKGNKLRLLEIVTRITEGYKNQYKTGSGQSVATKRRVLIYERAGDVTPVPKNRKKKGDDLGDASTIATNISGLDANPIVEPSIKVVEIPLNLTIPNATQVVDITAPSLGYIDLNGNVVKSPVTVSTGSSSKTSQPVMYYAAPALISSTDTGTSANANALHPDHLLSTRSLETAIIGMSHLDVTDDGGYGRIKRGSSNDNFSSALPPTHDVDVMVADSRLSEDTLNMALNAVLDCTPRPSLDGTGAGTGQPLLAQCVYDTRVSDMSMQMLNLLAYNDRDSSLARHHLEGHLEGASGAVGEAHHPADGDMFSQASHNSYFNSIFGGISYQNGMDMMYNDETILDQPQYYAGGSDAHHTVDDDDDSIKHSRPSIMSQMDKKNARYSSGASQYSNTHPQRQFGPGFGQAQMYEQHQKQQEFKMSEAQGNIHEEKNEYEDDDDGVIHAGASRLSFISALSNSGGPPKKYNNNLFRSFMMPPQNPSARAATQMQAQQQLFMQHQQRAEQEIQQLQLQQQQYQQQQQPQTHQSPLFYSSNMAPPLNPPHARTVPYPQQLGPSNGYYQDWLRNNAATPFSSDKETDTTASFSTPSGSPRPLEHSASSQSYFNGNQQYVPHSTAGVEYLHENHYVQSKQQDQRGKSFHPGSLVSNAMTSMSSTFRRVFPKKSSSAKQYNR